MTDKKNWTVLFATIVIGSAPVLTILGPKGADEDSVSLALRMTAWIAFLIYLLVFITRPVRQLLKTRLSATMMRNRRYLGIAFAGAHSIHLALIIVFVLDFGSLSPSLLIGAIAYALLYAMLITSFDGPARAIGPVAWRRLHRTGLYWIGGTFAYTLISSLYAEPGNPYFRAFMTLLAAAVAVRVGAFIQRRSS